MVAEMLKYMSGMTHTVADFIYNLSVHMHPLNLTVYLIYLVPHFFVFVLVIE